MKLYLNQNGDITADLEIRIKLIFSDKDPLQEELGSFEREIIKINQDALSRLKLFNKVGEILLNFLCGLRTPFKCAKCSQQAG